MITSLTHQNQYTWTVKARVAAFGNSVRFVPFYLAARMYWVFMKNPASINIIESPVMYLSTKSTSLIRWGDGETALLAGKGIHYQRSSLKLSWELWQIWWGVRRNPEYVLGVPVEYLQMNKQELAQTNRHRAWMQTRLLYLISGSRWANYTQALAFRNNGLTHRPFTLDPSPLWTNAQRVIVVHHSQDAMDRMATSFSEISWATVKCPARDGFESISHIEPQIHKLISESSIPRDEHVVLLACGPLGKVLARRLSVSVRVYDLGLFVQSKYGTFGDSLEVP